MLDRRHFLAVAAGAAAVGLSTPATAAVSPLVPDSLIDQSAAFSRLLAEASARNEPVVLPAGNYVVSRISLPSRVRLAGVPGATRLIHGGDGHFLSAEGCEHVEISGLVVDGANRWLGDRANGLIDARAVPHFVLDNCTLLGSSKNLVALERVSGRVERCDFTGAADAAIWSVDAGRMRIAANTIADCGNGGILVHRWQTGDDGTIVTGNRIDRILARNGGTGQYGNGINVFRAGRVIISDNQIADCAFSAIRSNSGNAVQIRGNSCLRSGETAIYSEFAFEGAVIANNIVDGAANGISVVNFNEGGRMSAVTGNLVRNLSRTGPYPADPPGFGIGIAVEADTTVTANVIENAPLFGMNLGWGPYLRNVVATGNVIRNSGEGIGVSVVEGVGAAIIVDNVIEGARKSAIRGYRWIEPATGDLARDGSTFPLLTVERNLVN